MRKQKFDIYKVIKKYCLSKAAVAKLLFPKSKFPKSAFNRKANGISQFTIDEIIILAEFLRVDICEIINVGLSN